ncbi:hypothetical protein FRC02_006458 [Tulasnella sp. 418]|nr:hypothetical protein FRC02_006458 [Tulasnella sp. 418]
MMGANLPSNNRVQIGVRPVVTPHAIASIKAEKLLTIVCHFDCETTLPQRQGQRISDHYSSTSSRPSREISASIMAKPVPQWSSLGKSIYSQRHSSGFDLGDNADLECFTVKEEEPTG